jgi:enoyl-CoA hydratase/carnithine racemase
MAKDCVNKAYNLPLDQGLEYEKRVFWSTFAVADQKEGMGAFAEKRKASWKHN